MGRILSERLGRRRGSDRKGGRQSLLVWLGRRRGKKLLLDLRENLSRKSSTAEHKKLIRCAETGRFERRECGKKARRSTRETVNARPLKHQEAPRGGGRNFDDF